MPDVCPHRPPCPGCPALGSPLEGLPVVAELRELATRTGARFELAPGRSPHGYRHRARLAIRGGPASPKLGIFLSGTHRVLHIPDCLVQHPTINRVAAALDAAIRETALLPYADASHRGLLRYAQVMLDRSGSRAQLTVVSNSQDPDALAALWPALQSRLGDTLQGLFWNGQPGRSNAILGPHWKHIAGEPALDDVLAGARVFFPPSAFAQNNPAVYVDIIDRIGSWVPDGSRVLELYAGVGTIGLSMLPRAQSLTFNELGAGSLAGLELGLQALAETERRKTQVLPGRAGEHAAHVLDADIVLVDPPRKGLDQELLDALCAPSSRPRELIYVSCGPEALVCETERLHPFMPLRELVLFDLFPWTGHVEALARFVRPPG